MTEKEIRNTLDPIAAAIREAGLTPYDQLYGYAETGNEMYITRKDNARERIKTIDKNEIKRYLKMIPRY